MNRTINIEKEERTKAILKNRSELLKIEDKIVENRGELIKALEFTLSDERYAIDLSYVNEVIHINDITSLPCTPSFILGIINVRGRIISVIDLKKLFRLPETGITNLNRVIVVNHEGIELGILADDIIGNQNIFSDNLQSDISTITEVPDNFIIGISKDRLIMLDIKLLLLNKEIIVEEEVV